MISPAIVQRASEWMVRLWADDASDADRAACERWRVEHPHHELAWRRLQSFDDKLSSTPREVARHVLREPAPAAFLARRRALQLLGLSITIGGATYLVGGGDRWQIAMAGYSTATGEIRAITLADGSTVVLSSASAIDVRFTQDERLIVLWAGEILVTSAPDPAPAYRPLRVRDRHGTVQALGTRFTVRQQADNSHVAVFEGAVDVRPAHGTGIAVRLDAGQGSSFNASTVQAPASVQQSAAAWAQGLLVADGMRLDTLLAELAHYRPGLLRCDPAIAHLKVSGVFSVRDTDRALHNLTRVLPVDLVSRTRYWVTVRAATPVTN
ncbi:MULTISPECIES: FecR domain-containing protein [unclassified Janthinobacterium]|uniref:FecR domain-containing protein n=1 Tax=unclassified Janthinobacterium TaxID=2610881 RepID=UPI00179682FA|nr:MULTISPECIES: FecR domain-containing protein [unclassified Janthinobacterium]MBB5610923.1 transmembrane sensor [Janthinobacterium sp. S3T4]MBB5616409.1 transmembrane sensor [Janthinobacterium sp. S3M3]